MTLWQRIAAFFTVITTFITSGICPAKPIFSESQTHTEKQYYDEGEFVLGENDIIVSSSADENGDGTQENPMTLFKAKEKLKKIGGSERITVWLHEGEYILDDTLCFDKNDRKNVTYRSFPNEKAVISSASAITDWTQTQVNGVRALVSDIDFTFNALYNSETRLQRSRYPKKGEFTVKGYDEEDIHCSASPYFYMNSEFYLDKKDLLDFKNPEDVYIRIMHYWKDEMLPLYSVDTASGEIKTAKVPSMTVAGGDRCYFENVFEALSEQGEWYIDCREMKVYYIPFDNETAQNTVLFAPKCEELIKINECDGLKFEGITFSGTDFYMRDGESFATVTKPFDSYVKYLPDHPQAAYDIRRAAEVSKSENVYFVSCRFKNTGASALGFGKASRNCGALSCEFTNIGANAVYISGVNDTLNPDNVTQNITVYDCHINGYGKVFNNAIGVLQTHAKNSVISHNEIHDGFYTAISVGWTWGYADNVTNNNKIEYNLLYDIGQGWLSDMGGIYTLGIQSGTVLRGNVIHDVGCYGGDSGYGGWGVYLDEGSSNILVEKNLVYNCSSQGFHQHYGKDNMIVNNIFALNGEGQTRITRLEEHNSLHFERNIFLADKTPIHVSLRKDNFTDKNNIYWDLSRRSCVKSVTNDNPAQKKLKNSKGTGIVMAMGYYVDGVFEDPLFKDPKNFDFTLADNSPALEAGFEKWDYYMAGTVSKF